jgi:hypothetical protein
MACRRAVLRARSVCITGSSFPVSHSQGVKKQASEVAMHRSHAHRQLHRSSVVCLSYCARLYRGVEDLVSLSLVVELEG